MSLSRIQATRSIESPPSLPEESPTFYLSEGRTAFCPIFHEIPKEVAEKAKLLFINYPNNPTSAIAEKSFFEEVVAFAKRHQNHCLSRCRLFRSGL